MNLKQTRDQILADITSKQNPRELVIAKTPDFGQNPREVLKDKKIKRYNNISRLSEESDLVKVSKETCLLAETASLPSGQLTSSNTFESATASPGEDRLRELKPYADDSDAFAHMYLDAIEQLKETPAQNRRSYCIGRLHDRGKRSAWYADMMMLGILDDQDHLKAVILNIEGEEFEIQMDMVLSDRQTMYHSQGRHGDLKRSQRAPRLATAPSDKF